jgi:TRAP-type C4-dicarboxylate transport system permease small subunit
MADLRKLIAAHWLEAVLCIVLVAIVVVTFAQVLFRYVFRVPFPWAEEIARFLLMWLATLTAAYGFKLRSHLALTLIVERLPAGAQRAIAVVVAVLISAFMVVFVVKGIDLVWTAKEQFAGATEISMAIPYASAIVGGLLIIYYVLRVAWDELRRPRKP